jgi:ABC-2 type transport system permease protein
MNYLKTIMVLGKNLLLRFFRDKTALFFTFLFPLIFLFVFGSIFSDSGGASFSVALINNSESEFAAQFVEDSHDNDVLNISDTIDLDEAKEQVGRGELDAIIRLPEDFGQPSGQSPLPRGELTLLYDQSDQQIGQTLSSVLNGVFDEINSELAPSDEPFTVATEQINTANLTQFDYLFSGLVGFSILSLAIFGLSNGLPSDKKTGVLRRLEATPLTAAQLVLATMLVYVVVGLLSVALMYIVGFTVFDATMVGSWVWLLLFILLSIILLLGFGLAIGGWAKNENQASPLANIVAFPMMFLSGVFFPRFLMPDWLQEVSAYIPLTPVVDGVRLIMTEAKTLVDLGPQLLLMGVWTVVIYAIAVRVFRWQ